ncbi:hypothetical protein FCULG_00005849 [Fusarium culmorum]|uniref:Xylanolytic transcriptional activator regulatory domain-containing protein n=1 Tax=Fusarium culmorum TaxID=5516 RepID=A0A2T4GWG9_FUSCU|nr:hypothetical protein FCULG_00005849 [Fusarium culmorum]
MSTLLATQALATTAGVLAQDPLIRLAEIAALEERVSRIERMSDRSRSMNDSGEPDNSRYHTQERPAFNHAASTSPSLLVDTLHLSRSTPAMALLAAFAAPTSEQGSPNFIAGATPRECPQGHIETMVDSATEETLFNIYNDKVQWRLLLARNRVVLSSGFKQEDFYRIAVTRHLAHIFKEVDPFIHIQAYLIISMHAVYSPSTERIITITSAAMRYCVMAQLHCGDAEPEPVDVAARIRTQLRRRIFWCAHKLDRTVGGTYHLPLSISNYQITVKLYANIEDAELDDRCRSAFPDEVQGVARYTDVFAALHVVYCRQIQSEILN